MGQRGILDTDERLEQLWVASDPTTVFRDAQMAFVNEQLLEESNRPPSVPRNFATFLPAPPRRRRAKRLNITVSESTLIVIDADATQVRLKHSAYPTHAALTQTRRDKGAQDKAA